jgi:Tfp pilus assembly protein PilF
MKRIAIIALIGLFALAGCAAFNKANESKRLRKIDSSFTRGEVDAALTDARKFVQDYPGSDQGWSLLGWIYLKKDDLSKAEECFDKALSINARWDNAHVGKGVMYRKLGDNAKARESYLKALGIAPENAEAYASLLVIELLEGNNKTAVTYGEKAWALRKDSGQIAANLSVAYHYVGDYSRRDQYFSEAKRLGYKDLEKLKNIFDGKSTLQ